MNRRAGFDVLTPVALPMLASRHNAQMQTLTPMVSAATGVTVTANASAHTYGTWTELVASTTVDITVLHVCVNTIGVNATNTASVVSIGIGAGGAEVELFAYACGSHGVSSSSYPPPSVLVPVFIPKGTRIAARLQSVIAGGKTGSLLVAGTPAPPSFIRYNTKVDTIGVNLATSEGVAMGASNTWTQVIASTTQPYRGLVLVPSFSEIQNGAVVVYSIGVGASGSEVALGTYNCTVGSSEIMGNIWPSALTPVMRHIPAGTRIVARQSAAFTSFDACVLGIPY